TNCTSCHGKDAQMGGLRLDSRAALLKGGDGGPGMVVGDPEKSLLVEVVRHTGKIKMPQGGKLKPEEIAALEAWVKMGAPWPESNKVAAPAPAGANTLWSLKPVVKPIPPKVNNATWAAGALDRFVLAKLEAQGLKPSPPADRRTLLRRVSYDLTGLPPTAEEVAAFVADKSPDAYRKVVDRLLDSPRYGERWARHWLDLARYSDTKGYVFVEDRNYPNAYTYRNWVIKAFNDDMPYDRFVQYQLAADRMPGADPAQQAALGFLTVGRRFLNNQHDIIDDRIDVTMRGLQGLTVACARCHDHKFDPVPTQDYYSLYGVFASSVEASPPISPKPISEPWVAHDAKVKKADEERTNLLRAQIKRLRDLVGDEKTAATVAEPVRKALQGFRERELPDDKERAAIEPAFEAPARERIAALAAELETLRRSYPPKPEFAMAMADSPSPHHARVLRRGNPGTPGDEAPRRFLLALSKPGGERPVWNQGSGRLELARAIASKENPLTARVFVNRVWAGHFGSGIVRTPSDFGRQGEKPTHPELLDWLAATFVEQGWSVKQLHRMIVLSSAYRQSSAYRPDAYAADADNRLVWRMNRRRLDMEQMRDTLLNASGKLDTAAVGGPSVELWEGDYSTRRTVYGRIERQNLPGVFRTFDFASPDTSSAGRFQTTVPQQALFLMNSRFAGDQARALAARPEVANAKDDAARVRALYRRLFGRQPDADELALGVAFLGGTEEPAYATAPVWRYGYGPLDEKAGRVAAFTPLPHFTGGAYQGGPKLPDPNLSFLMLSPQGGHTGKSDDRSPVRRWTATRPGAVKVSGTLKHGNKEGDGVEGVVVSSRSGIVGRWIAHNGEAKTEATVADVRPGDTLDFVVRPRGSDAFDSFQWSPQVTDAASGKPLARADKDFGGPPAPPTTKRERYAHALLMTNEFLFVD
ncbi:MAG TPA: PSD1 and planctomycete cytochrome C domain-containing protein, partial [Armatimonadaceae bacterium]|nr:PSD1 and planctomycete cytochrome C domain-containing protein [Armatimonadaceae bacterium]